MMTDNIWRDGSYLVLRKTGYALPDRCVLCNQSANGRRLRFTLYDQPTVGQRLCLLVFSGALLYPLMFFMFVTKVRVRFGLCEIHRGCEAKRRRITRMLFWLAIAIIVGTIRAGPPHAQWPLWVMLGAVLLLIGSVIYDLLRPRPIRSVRVDSQFVWIDGADPDYLAEFPDALQSN